MCRVEWSISEQLSAQRSPDQGKGCIVSGVHLNASSWFWRTNFFQKWIRNEKVMPPLPPKLGDQELKKKTTHRTLQSRFLNTRKNSWYVALLLLQSKDDL
jgi:hypothetical protein